MKNSYVIGCKGNRNINPTFESSFCEKSNNQKKIKSIVKLRWLSFIIFLKFYSKDDFKDLDFFFLNFKSFFFK